MYLLDKANKDPLHKIVILLVALLFSEIEQSENQENSDNIITINHKHLRVLGTDIALINKALRWLAGQGIVSYVMMPVEAIIAGLEDATEQDSADKQELSAIYDEAFPDEIDSMVPEKIRETKEYKQAKELAQNSEEYKAQVLQIIQDNYAKDVLFVVFVNDFELLGKMNESEAFSTYYQSFKK